MNDSYDVVIVGSGPNGLTAGALLAATGRSVLILEAADEIGGGTRTTESNLPGFLHDHCSAVHPLGVASPAFRALSLQDHGLEWIHSAVTMAHPLDGGRAAAVTRSAEQTAESMGPDAEAWRRLVGRAASNWDRWADIWLSPVLPMPQHPMFLAGSALKVLRSATSLARGTFKGDLAMAAFAGFAAHSIVPLDRALTGAPALLFNAAAHAVGMPIARGGSRAISDALASCVRSAGGEIETGRLVRSSADIPPATTVLLDVTPRQALAIAPDRMSPRVVRAFGRYRYGAASFKLDLALSGPVPWTAAACRDTATVHIGGTIDEIARAEREVWAGQHPDRPFIIACQPAICDVTRAPAGKHPFWMYCHVPRGSDVDMTEPMLRQVERFAPGFRDLILATTTTTPASFERANPNFVGGDIAGGDTGGLRALLRPRVALNPWKIGRDTFLCSQSTPPGVGVHGMCGWWAAQAVLRQAAAAG